ncbi:MAG: hypothetical protein J6Q51_03515, partial [Clostridia bacterium]|nr:hypothetical protein [Clostridia bacterium]
SEHRDQMFTAYKTSNVTARKGKVGEVVETIMKNGMRETKNIVSYDPVTGEPDWVVTQANGEQMIVTDSKYKSLYYVADAKPGQEVKPVPLNRPMLKVEENVCLVTSWGEMQYINAGGVLVTLAANDIYGIQQEEFEKTYQTVENVDAKPIFDENIQTVVDNNKPKIFLSVAYPYDNEKNQQILKEVVRYLNSKGIMAVNVRKIQESNVNLVKEIAGTLEKCEGILSLAFNKGQNKTSPFIHIENSLASTMNLANLMIVPEEVEKEGVLYSDNNDGVADIDGEKSLYDPANQDVLEELNNFIEQVTKRYQLKINDKDLARFKSGLLTVDKTDQTREQIVEFLKAFYQVKDLDFSMRNVFVKRPTQIKAVVVKQSGMYETKDGVIELKEGDFLVMDNDSTVKPYAVKQEQFNLRYAKVIGTEDTYVTKLSPVIATKVDNQVKICPLVDPSDIYYNKKEEFAAKYESLEDYILNLQISLENSNVNNLGSN